MSQFRATWRDGFTVTWRNLTWGEYRKFKSAYDNSLFDEPMDVALGIYKTVYLDGPDPKYVPAGIVGYICDQQMSTNPFSGRYKDLVPALSVARQVVQGDFLQSTKGIIAATLNYKLEEIDQWDPVTFFTRLAQTELATGRTFEPVDPHAEISPTGKPKKLQKPKKDLTASQQIALDRTKQERGR